jgi:vesicle-fusing ATPase
VAGSTDVDNLRVHLSDFQKALDEVRPAFGVSEEALQNVTRNGIIRYDSIVDVRPVPSFSQRPGD